MLRVGRIPYINTYPVYGAVDRGVVLLGATLVVGVPSALNAGMAAGTLDVSVVSAVEYAAHAERYLLLPDLAISCDGPVRSVMLFSKRPIADLDGATVLVSRSSMTSVELLALLFEARWNIRPRLIPADAESADIAHFASEEHAARLVIGDAALLLSSGTHPVAQVYPHCVDLGQEWKAWTGLPFVFAVWVAQRTTPVAEALQVHARLIVSRDWGMAHLPALAAQAALATGVSRETCQVYLSGLDYRLSLPHLRGLTEFYRRLDATGRVEARPLVFLPAA
ncbi:MAG TPA: menaquinone biosynthesis protein [Gemmatimonadaceae bacterium]|nr:menaquinone biosynthesis protein [Gemmatimonadaceae bacterium]